MSDDTPIGTADAEALFQPLSAYKHVLVAVSGGTDSTVLMLLLAQWQKNHPDTALSIATVDHGLRPQAAIEAEAVGSWARALGLPHRTLVWSGPHPKTGLQQAARAARYCLLVDHARSVDADVLVTAHHADDQAETVLMRLVSGSGLAGLAGMKAVGETLGLPHLRPLLSLPKARLAATLQHMGHPFFNDPSNTDPRFARARWREAQAVLAREGFDAQRMTRFSTRMARADAALESRAAQCFETFGRAERGNVHIFSTLFQEPDEIVLRVIAKGIAHVSPAAPLRLERLESVIAALIEARQQGTTTAKTLAGAQIRQDRHGNITIIKENDPRRKISVVDEDETHS